jgi:hypothetical protein
LQVQKDTSGERGAEDAKLVQLPVVTLLLPSTQKLSRGHSVQVPLSRSARP